MLVQRDTYFAVGRGRLKLREDIERGTGELIFYLRADEAACAPAATGARRRRPGALPSLLEAAHGVAGTVRKRRRLFLHRNVRIHLDEVEGLGASSSSRACSRSPGEESAAEAAALAEVVTALGLAGREAIAVGYLELMR